MWKYENLNPIQHELLAKNTIDLQGEVDSSMALYVRESLVRLSAKGSPDVKITITSTGGDVDCGLDIFDYIRLYPGKTTGVVVGYAKSMAAIILQACTHRTASAHSRILIHHISRNQLSLNVLRSRKELRALKSAMEKSQARLYEVLSGKTGKSIGQIKRECEKDNNMFAEEALSFGLIDEIV